MPGRPLSAQELSSAIREINKEAHPERWPDPTDLVALARAVKSNKPTVVLNNVEFKIRYTTKFEEAVFVSPAGKDQFVPCGYFSIERLERLG